MSQALLNQNPVVDVDDSYRRSSAVDASRPSEWVRRKVMAHASQVGAERSVRDSAKPRASASKSHAAPAAPAQSTASSSRLPLFGGVAVGVVALAFGAWHFLSPGAQPATPAA